MPEVPILNDTLRDHILPFIGRVNLPNILSTNRRYWWLSNEALDSRVVRIFFVELRADNQLKINGRVVPIAEVGPPRNYELVASCSQYETSITMSSHITDVGWRFFAILQNMLTVVRLNAIAGTLQRPFLAALASMNIAEMNLNVCEPVDGFFFTQESFTRCPSIIISVNMAQRFNGICLFDWLHTPVTSPAIRQLHIQYQTFYGPEHFIRLIINKFSNDNEQHQFVFRWESTEFQPDVLLRNRRTGEVLFSRTLQQSRELVRSSAREQSEIVYANYENENFHHIFIADLI